MSTKTVQRLVSELDEWIARSRNKELLLDGAKTSLRKYLDGNSPTAIASLSNMAFWLGQSGAHRVLHGDLSGWDEIATSLQFMAWDQRTLFAMMENRTAKSVHIRRSIFVLLHAICTGQDGIATWFGTRLISAFEGKERRVIGWDTPLYLFALHLFAKWNNDQLITPPLHGVYQNVLDEWNNKAAFAESLVVACDYHLKQAFDDSDNDTQDFFFTLYNIFPVEILAIKRIRERDRLPMSDIDHSLMKSKLADLPERMPSSHDDFLQKVIAKVCTEFGIGERWVKFTTKRLGLESSFRPRSRPKGS